jgi:mannose-6-phosphate isomerase-like protein (cupin superfamily)
MTDEFPRKTEKPWGFELLFAHAPGYAGKVIFVKKGHRLSLQYHEEKDETLYVSSGKAVIETAGGDGQMSPTELTPGRCIRIPPGTRHRLKAIEDTTVFEVSTPELDDVVRVEDDYGRAE